MWLSVLTTVLLLTVVVLAVIAGRLALAERRRSEARVAALSRAIDDPGWTPSSGVRIEGSVDNPCLVFEPETRPARVPAWLALCVAGIVLVPGMWLLLDTSSESPDPRRGALTSEASSLELLSMRHAVAGDTFIVSGLVRNPSKRPSPSLTVVLSALDRDGRLVARGRSRLDPLVLEPGKETSFRVSVTQTGNLGRYRLGFVDGDRVVPHVDRRDDLSQRAVATDQGRN